MLPINTQSSLPTSPITSWLSGLTFGPIRALLKRSMLNPGGAGKLLSTIGHIRATSALAACMVTPGPQSGNAFITELAKRCFATIETKRQEECGLLPIEEAEFLRHHPDDLARFAVHSNGLSHNGLIRAKAALPIVIAEHHRVRAAGTIIDAIEPATEIGRQAENRKNAIGHIESLHLFGVALPGNADRVSLVNPDVYKCPVLLAINEVVRRRHIHFIDIQSRGRVPHSHQRFRMRVGQRLQQDTLDHAEHCNVGAYAGGKCNQRDRGEDWCAPQPAHNLLELAEEGSHNRSSARRR